MWYTIILLLYKPTTYTRITQVLNTAMTMAVTSTSLSGVFNRDQNIIARTDELYSVSNGKK